MRMMRALFLAGMACVLSASFLAAVPATGTVGTVATGLNYAALPGDHAVYQFLESSNDNNMYQLPSGIVTVTVSSNITEGWYTANVTFSNGTTEQQCSTGDTWFPTLDWLDDALLPWAVYIPSSGPFFFTVDYNEYHGPGEVSLPLGVISNVSHVENAYICHLGNVLPGNLTITWDDRSGILLSIESNNSMLVGLLTPYAGVSSPPISFDIFTFMFITSLGIAGIVTWCLKTKIIRN
jgi:hypothetical protein